MLGLRPQSAFQLGHAAYSQLKEYGGGPVEFFRILSEWRDAGTLEGLDIS